MKNFLKKFLAVVLIKVICVVAELLSDMFGEQRKHTPESA